MRLLWTSEPVDAIFTAQVAGTLQERYERGARPAATRWAFVAAATADARSWRGVTELWVTAGATAGAAGAAGAAEVLVVVRVVVAALAAFVGALGTVAWCNAG
ncbi:MAG: hypothetical protein ACYC1E_08405 [Propionibacteriaceae bacterium]